MCSFVFHRPRIHGIQASSFGRRQLLHMSYACISDACTVEPRQRFVTKSILVRRAYDPSGLQQESRALGATISGMHHRCRCAVSRITRIRLFPLFFHNGCSQSSRFLSQARRIVGSGVKNGLKAEEKNKKNQDDLRS